MTDQHQTEAQRLAALLRSRNNNQVGFGLGPVCDEAALELLRLNAVHTDLERVKMQLAACGVVAMADTPDSAKKARIMHPDYESASCDDVKRRVDECIALRARVAELEDVLTNLPLSSPQRLRARIQRLEEMLAAVGAGGVGPLMPITVQHQRNPISDNELQRENGHLSTTAAPPQTGGIPPDWKLVPVEPTDDMLYDIQEFSHILPPRGRRIWSHMLAAAPNPPVVEQEPVAYMHDVVASDGEPDQALSFWKDNFPLEGLGGFRSVGFRPLYTHPQNLQCKSSQVRLATLWGYVKEQPQQEQEWKRRLGNLLAVIHGDGGHYIDAHGWDKAQADAEEKAARVMTGLPQSASAVWPRNASEVRAFLSGRVAAERYARDDHQPDDSDTYTLSAHDLLGAIDWWTDFDRQPRQPLTDEQIMELFRGVWTDGTQAGPVTPMAIRVARAIERAVLEKAREAAISAHGIGGEA